MVVVGERALFLLAQLECSLSPHCQYVHTVGKKGGLR